MTPFVSGLVLAAGGSTRFGRPKQLLPFQGTTLLGWVAGQASRARELDELIVVVGGAARDVTAQVDFGRARVVHAADYQSGCAASYRSGIGALDAASDAVAVILGDQPGVDSDLIDRVVGEWRRRPQPILVTSYRGRIGHPMIFARECFVQLSGLSGDKAAWKMVDARPGATGRIEMDRPYPPDVNTPDDYAKLVEPARDLEADRAG